MHTDYYWGKEEVPSNSEDLGSLLKVLPEYVSGGAILDYGCGNGSIANALIRRGTAGRDECVRSRGSTLVMGMKLSATHHKGEFPSNDPLVVREQDHAFTHGLSEQKTVEGTRISCIGVDIFKTVDVPQFKI